MADNFDERAKELEEKAERLLASSRKKPSASHRESNTGNSRLNDTIETAREFNLNISWLRRISGKIVSIYQYIAACIRWMWLRSGPIRICIGPTFRYISKTYGRFFRWAAYKEDPSNGERKLSRARTTCVIALTAALPFIIWYSTKPVLMTIQQGVMALISEKEAYTYFHGSETIEEGRLYTVKTTSRVPATPESTMHMQVQQDVFYWIWYPEDLANAVPNEVAWGRVKYTGWRVKFLDWFPEVKDIEAIPLSELPENHPAKSGNYYISDEALKQAERDGMPIPGTDLNMALAR